MNIEGIIRENLNAIEEQENVIILLAVESGSRAWGFASPDSDYDVRFIYVRPKEYYLKLNRGRDVIEYMLDDVWDINGWDLDKTLKLLYSSNPTLFEWLSSPIVYREHPFINQMREKTDEYFLAKSGLHHYINMAESNYRGYLKGEIVRTKKYFYVLRPILACKHILCHQTPPPMLFDELLYDQMDAELISVVERLLDIKKKHGEVFESERIDALNDYIESMIPLIREEIGKLPSAEKKGWEVLDKMFLDVLIQQ